MNVKTTGRLVAMLATAISAGSAAAAEAATRPKLEISVLASAQSVDDSLTSAITPLLPTNAIVSWKHVTGSESMETPPRTGTPDVRHIRIDARSKDAVRITAFFSAGAPYTRIIDASELTPVVAESVAQVAHETARALLAEVEPAGSGQMSASVSPKPAPTPPPPSAALAPMASVAASPAVSDSAYATRPRDFRFSVAAVVRNVYGFNFNNAYGGDVSIAWSFKRPSGGSSPRPFVALSMGYSQQEEWGFYAAQVAQTFGLFWQPWSFTELSLGVGAGVERAKIFGESTNVLFGRGAFGASLLLPGGFEEMVTLTLDASQVPSLGGADAKWFRPGFLIGVGWRPRM